MAIESTYQSLLGGQRKRQKKQERNDMLIQAGTLATNLYQSKLDAQAEDFFNRSEVANQRVKYQEGRDLYENKIKKLYDQGSAYVGGHGEYLVANQARQLAQERIYANMDEENVFDPDDLGSAITSYSRELVYGKKGEDGTISEEAKKQGMLYRLEQAYNSGKNLASMDKYDEYVSKRADLPENVGGALMNKLVRGKSRTDLEADALNRVVNENNFVKDSEAFVALSKSFDAGLTIKDSEKLAQKVESYTKNIKMKPEDKVIKRELMTTKIMGSDGSTTDMSYYEIQSQNRNTGAITTSYAPNPANQQHTDLFNNKQITVRKVREPIKGVHALYGTEIDVEQVEIVTFGGDTAGKIIPADQQEKFKQVENILPREIITEATNLHPALVSAAGTAVSNIINLNPHGGAQDIRDSFDTYFSRLEGDDAEIKTAKEVFHRNIALTTASIQQDFKFSQNLSRRLAAVIGLEQVNYINEQDDQTANYKGANISSSQDINGLRVFAALNYLHMNDTELDLTEFGNKNSSRNEILSGIAKKLITPKELKKFAGKKAEIGVQNTFQGSVFDEDSRTFYTKKMKSLPQALNGKENLFNLIKIPSLELEYPNATIEDIILTWQSGKGQYKSAEERRREREETSRLGELNTALSRRAAI